MQSHDQVLPQPMEYLWTLQFEALQNIPSQSPIFLIWANLHFISTQILPIRSTRHHPSLHPINTLSPILIVFKDAKSYDKMISVLSYSQTLYSSSIGKPHPLKLPIQALVSLYETFYFEKTFETKRHQPEIAGISSYFSNL